VAAVLLGLRVRSYYFTAATKMEAMNFPEGYERLEQCTLY